MKCLYNFISQNCYVSVNTIVTEKYHIYYLLFFWVKINDSVVWTKNTGEHLVKEPNNTMSVKLRMGVPFALKEQLLTSFLIP